MRWIVAWVDGSRVVRQRFDDKANADSVYRRAVAKRFAVIRYTVPR